MQILATKLHLPRTRPGTVGRPRLVDRLEQGHHCQVTLISAPAGFGKTTLAAQWIAASGRPAAWISLEPDDGEPARFLGYVIAGLQSVLPGVGQGVLNLLGSPQPPAIPFLLTELLNEIAAADRPVVLVLDDYHALDGRAVDEILTFVTDHQPPTLHLLLITREDPGLPLARLRAGGQLWEVREADLRFTQEEAAQFLGEAMGLRLDAQEVAALEARTEGWIVGLQLAGLSLQGRSDAGTLIRSFSGGHHFVLDYLMAEVLHRQSQEVQDFLLRTAILERLCGDLCAVLLDGDEERAQQDLQTVRRANLFLVPLDDERRWYRYHHLFRDLLRKRLTLRAEVDVADLHRRAGGWYADHGFPVEAFEHAAASGDTKLAMALIAGRGVPLYLQGAAGPVLRWLDSLSDEVKDAQPALWAITAAALTVTGREIQRVEGLLERATIALTGAEWDGEQRELAGQMAVIRAMLAGPQRDIDGMLVHAGQALELLPPENQALRTLAVWCQGLAHQSRGERQAARQRYEEALATGRATANPMVTVAALTSLGQIWEADNQLQRALEAYEGVMALAGEPPWPTACEAYLGRARIRYQWNDLDRAREDARLALALGRQIENVDTPAACGVLLAEMDLAQGNPEGAITALAEATRFARGGPFEGALAQIREAEVRLALATQGATAIRPEDAPSPLSRARLHLARGEAAAALEILTRLQEEAKARAWHRERLQAMVLQALAHAGRGDLAEGLGVLQEALALAAPGEPQRLFLDEGPEMRALLAEAARRAIRPDYTGRMLAAFDLPRPAGNSATSPLVEPLSPRELQVLALIARGLSNREIGERLYLALDTVKGHNRRIYAKLQVTRRTEAVARARELGLL